MAGSRMVGGIYHPRSKGGAMSDALADAKRALARLARMAALRGAGLTLVVAAGLGILPAPASLPAGAGGWIGIAATGLSAHAAQTFGAPSLSWVLPLFLLLTG